MHDQRNRAAPPGAWGGGRGGARGQESQRRGGSPNARMKEWNLIEGEWHCTVRPSSFTQTMGLPYAWWSKTTWVCSRYWYFPIMIKCEALRCLSVCQMIPNWFVLYAECVLRAVYLELIKEKHVESILFLIFSKTTPALGFLPTVPYMRLQSLPPAYVFSIYEMWLNCGR